MSDQDQYGNYMAQQPQPINKHVNQNVNGNYNGSGNSQSFPDYPQSPGGYASQQQVMYGELAEQSHYSEDGFRGYSEYGAQEYYAGSGEKLQPVLPRRRSMRGFWPLLVLVAFVIMMAGAVTSFHDGPGMQFSSGSRHMMPGMGFDKGRGNSTTQTVNLVSGMTPILKINDPNGSVSVNSGSANDVITVTVNSRDGNGQKNIPFNFDKQNDTLSIGTSGFGDGMDIIVTTPTNVNVNVQDGSGDVQLQGIIGQVSVQANDGAVSVGNISGTTTIATTSGSITADTISGQVNLTSQDGDISLTNAALQGNASVKSQGGTISFVGTLSQQGTYDFESVNGDVNLTLPTNSSFHLVNTSGNLTNEFNSSDVGSSPRPALTVSSQNGNPTISKGP